MLKLFAALSRILAVAASLAMGSTASADALPPEQVAVLESKAVQAALIKIGPLCYGECYTQELCHEQAMRYFIGREDIPTGNDLLCALQYLDRTAQLMRIAAAVTKPTPARFTVSRIH